MDMPLVSIVIVNYNRLKDLKETLKKTDDINWSNLEIILVDNGSTDGSVEFIKSLDNTKYRKILIFPNRGSAYSHTEGMKAAKGEFVITIDDDCFLRPSVISKTVELFQKNPNLAGIGYGFMNPLTDFDEKRYWEDTNFPVRENQFHDSYESIVATSGAAFRKSTLETIGYYDLNWFYYTEDVELCFNLIAHGFNTVTIPELVAYHKATATNRNFDQITFNGIRGTIWLILKYYPWPAIPLAIMRFLYLCIYFTIINRKGVYLRAVFGSLKKAHLMLANRIRLDYSLYKRILLPELLLFSR